MPTFKLRNGISFLLNSWVNLFIFCEFLERVWYIMRHTWYCLTQHSSICSSPTLLTLVRHPHHLRQHTNHLTHAGTPSHHASKHATHATLASTPPTSHTPPTLVGIARHFSNSTKTTSRKSALVPPRRYMIGFNVRMFCGKKIAIMFMEESCFCHMSGFSFK